MPPYRAPARAWVPISPVIPKPDQPDLSPFHVYRRTDGAVIIYDERAPLGRKTVKVFRASQTAVRDAASIARTMLNALNRETAKGTDAGE